MGQYLADRVKDTTTTTGTGTITITGTAPTGFATFASAYATDDSFHYCIEDLTNGAWEVGIGTLASSTTITRDIVLQSSNSDALVNFGSGTKTVFVTLPADTIQSDGLILAKSSGIINF